MPRDTRKPECSVANSNSGCSINDLFKKTSHLIVGNTLVDLYSQNKSRTRECTFERC